MHYGGVQLYTYNLSFSMMELGLRLAYLFVALLAMMVRSSPSSLSQTFPINWAGVEHWFVQGFVVKMRGIKFDEWTFEQKCAFFLVLGLLLYNGAFMCMHVMK